MSGGRFAGRVALVTGGGGAIGSATVRQLARAGAKVVVADLDAASAERVAGELNGADGERAALPVEGDTSHASDAARMVAAAVDGFGRLDVVVNNAGISGGATLLESLSDEDWDDVLRVNLRGVFLVLRESVRTMAAAGIAGSIVNMSSSMAEWDVLEGGGAYAASKAGVLGLTRVAALEAARHRIRVNAVCPGVIETPLGVPDLDGKAGASSLARFSDRIPLRRIGRPEDVAAVVCFLASDEAAHVNGAGWLIDGGQTLQSWSNAPGADAYPQD